MAALYIYRTRAGNSATITIGTQTIGNLQGGYWLRTDLAPGRHDVRCWLPAWGTVGSELLDLAPGSVTYLSATEHMSDISCHLVQQPPTTAQPAILAGRRVRELR